MVRPNSPERLRRRPLGRYRYVRLRWRVLFAVIDFAGGLLLALASSIRRMIFRDKSSAVGDPEPAAILLIQLDHLGDAIITTVMLPALRRRYRNASIEVLAAPWNREVFEASPEVDRVHVSRVNRFARKSRFAWIASTFLWGWRLRRRRFDIGIDIRGDFPLALMLWLSGTRRRVGWACGGGGFLLTDVAPYAAHRPEFQSRLALLDLLGIRPAAGDMWRPVFRPTRNARSAITFRLKELSHDPVQAGPRVVLHVGAGTAAKRWPAEHWRSLIARLGDWLDARMILVGGREDRELAERILGLHPPPGVVDWTGTLDVVELAALLERSEVFVGADSGPAHLAAAVGTPAVVLFSGTNNVDQWRPCGADVTALRRDVPCSPCHCRECPRPDHLCMTGLVPDRVAGAVVAILQQDGTHDIRPRGTVRHSSPVESAS